MVQIVADDLHTLAEYRRNFRLLFDQRAAQVALLDLNGVILETNRGWDQYATENGLRGTYQFVGKNYLKICEAAVGQDYPSAKDAYVGLLEVLQTRRPKFTLVYPCHSPRVRQWYRMWVEPQLPEVPAIIVAHYLYVTKPLVDLESTMPGFAPGGDVGNGPGSGPGENQRN
jgi:hypothetical protein